MSFLGFGKKKEASPSPGSPSSVEASAVAQQPAAQPAQAGGDWRQPSLTSYRAHELGLSQEQFDAAFEQARGENDRGAPFGGALWSALMTHARNHQAVDDLVDELPNEAFGPGPSAHFELIVRCWARATRSEARPEWQTYKSLAMAGGWRPGDANSAWLYEQLAGPPPVLQQIRHPMGLDMLPRELTLSRMELAVYSFLNDVLNRPQGGSVQ